MNNVVIASCSLCGGNVVVPKIWAGVIPPTPTCASCGATQQKSKKVVMPMEKPPVRRLKGLGNRISDYL